MAEPGSDHSVCPTDEVLAAHALGRLDDTSPWREHIDSCARCRAWAERQATADGQLTKLQPFPPSLAARPAAGPGGGEIENEVRRFLRPADRPDELGRLGPYRVLGVLGAGGMGVVLRADEPALDRRVALKVVHPHLASDPLARQRFQREARAMAAVEHEHVVPIFRIDEDAGVLFLAMPLLSGETLGDLLARERQLAPAAAAALGRQVAEGLAAAHARGLVHRDLKPANIWLEPRRDGGPRVRLLDFGLARAIVGDSELSTPGGVAGTPSYMSPEQARGQPLDERSDLFSLGIVLYRAVAGVAPFHAPDSLGTLYQIVTVTPTSVAVLVPAVPAGLSELIDRLLEKSPADRPQSAQLVADELAALAEPPPVPPAAPAVGAELADTRLTPPPHAPRTSRKWWYGLAGSLTVAACAVALIFPRPLKREGEPDVPPPAPPEAPFAWRLDPTLIPPDEGLPGRPKELVAVVGSRQRRHWGKVQELAVANSRVVTGARDGFRAWDAGTLQPLPGLPSRPGAPRLIAFTPSGDRLALTNADGELEVWGPGAPRRQRTAGPFPLPGPVNRLALAPSGDRLYMADDTAAGTIRAYTPTATELKPFAVLAEKVGPTWSLAVSPSGRWAGAGGTTGAVNLWDAQEKNRQHVLQPQTDGGRPHCLAFALNSRKCYVVGSGAGLVYDLSSGEPQEKGTFQAAADDRALGVFAGAERLVRVGEYSLTVWDATKDPPKLLNEWSLPTAVAIRAAGYDPELGRVFTGHDDGGVRAWDVGSDKAIAEVSPLPYSELARAAFSPDGRWLATHHAGLNDKHVLELFDLTGTQPRAIELPPVKGGEFGHPAFTPDGSALLAVGVRRAVLARWDLKAGSLVTPRLIGSRTEVIDGSSFRLVPGADSASAASFDLGFVRPAHRFYQPAEPPVQVLPMPAELNGLVVTDAVDGPAGPAALGTAGGQSYLIGWDRQGRNPVAESLPPKWPAHVGADADGLFVFGFQEGELLEQRAGGPHRTVFTFAKTDGAGVVAAASGNGERVAVAAAGGRLVVADRRSGAVLWEVRLPGPPAGLAFTRDGKGLMTANPDGTVFLLTGGPR